MTEQTTLTPEAARARAAEIADMEHAEETRHVTALDAIEAEWAALQAHCPHPEEAQTYDGGWACVVCRRYRAEPLGKQAEIKMIRARLAELEGEE